MPEYTFPPLAVSQPGVSALGVAMWAELTAALADGAWHPLEGVRAAMADATGCREVSANAMLTDARKRGWLAFRPAGTAQGGGKAWEVRLSPDRCLHCGAQRPSVPDRVGPSRPTEAPVAAEQPVALGEMAEEALNAALEAATEAHDEALIDAVLAELDRRFPNA